MTPEALVFVATCDLAGMVRGKSFPAHELESRLPRGVGIAPSNLLMSVFGPIYDTPFGTAGEVMLVPDPTTRTPIPMKDGPDGVLFLGDFRNLDGTAWSCCPRDFLRRALAALREAAGLTLYAAFEQELVYTGVEDRPGAPYTLDAFRRQGAFGGSVVAAMRAAGIVPDSFLAEYGPRQFEMTMAPAIGMRAADNAVLSRELARAVAAQLGQRAIFAPILDPDGIGNGTHIHWSLLDESGQPATHDPAGALGLSAMAEHFAAGLLRHLPALAAVTAPSAASYFRLRPGRWAPTNADLGTRDRGSAVRICPTTSLNPESVARQFNVEYRVADAAACPWLALGALVWAGVSGIRQSLRLADTSPLPLPQSLQQALDTFAADLATRDWFGRDLHDVYLRAKRAELAQLDGMGEQAICDRYAAIY